MIKTVESFSIEAINNNHVCARFRSDNTKQDRYLRESALEHDVKQIARSYVAANNEKTVLGYYSLSTASVEFAQQDERAQKRLTQYPVAAAMITHLAVDHEHAPREVAEKLLIDALRRINTVENEVGIKAIIGKAQNNSAIAFYLRFGFIKLPGHSDILFLPMETMKKVLKN